MIHGVGVDLVSLDRFQRFATDHAGRLPEMFTEHERTAGHEGLARAFALKEAALKAIGGLTGWELDWREIETPHLEGAILLSGAVAAHARTHGVGALHGSVSGSAMLLATVIAESSGVRGGAPSSAKRAIRS